MFENVLLEPYIVVKLACMPVCQTAATDALVFVIGVAALNLEEAATSWT